jgi:ABC-type sulfate transport system permease component
VTTVFLQYVIGFGLALIVWKEIAFQRFFRVLFLIPMMTTPVIMTVIWRTFFHESLGPVNDILSHFNLAPLWLSSETLSKFTVMIVEVWQWTPFMFLLLLAGLLSLPKEPFLAASIDGAGPIRTFVYVTFSVNGAYFYWCNHHQIDRSIQDNGHGLCSDVWGSLALQRKLPASTSSSKVCVSSNLVTLLPCH